MQLARLVYRLNTRTPARQASTDRRGAVAGGALLEARAARGVPERRAVRRQHPGRRRGEPDLLRQVAGSRDARRGADAGGHSAASGQPRRPRMLGSRRCSPRARELGATVAERATATTRPNAARSSCRSSRGRSSRCRGRRRTSSTRCSPVRLTHGSGRIDTTIDAGLQRLVERQIRRYLTSAATSGCATRRRCSWTRATCPSRRGSGPPTTGTTRRRPGERRAGQAVAGLDAEAVRLRARARSGRAASADDAARCADGVRSVHAGELRRPVLRTDHARGRADSQPQHSGGLGRGAADAAEPLSVPAERRRARSETRVVLRTGARARRRRSHDGGAGRAVRDARQRRRAAAAARRAVEPARGGRAAAQSRGELHHARHAAPQSAARRRRDGAASARAGRSRGRPARRGASATRGRPASSGRTCSSCGSATSAGRAIRRSSASMPRRRCSSGSPTR